MKDSCIHDYTTREEIVAWLETHGVTDYVIHDNLVVDIAAALDLTNQKIDHLPFQFGRVESDCFLNGNQLTTLRHAPYEVKGSFFCSYNRLTSLVGAPHTVEVVFDCSCNELTTLEGSPEKVPGWFICSNNKLMNLRHAPHEVGMDFEAHDNPLESLKDFTGMIRGRLFLTGFDLAKENILQWQFDCMRLSIKNPPSRLELLEKYYVVVQNFTTPKTPEKTLTLSIDLKGLKAIFLENKLQTELKHNESIKSKKKI